MVRMNVAIGPKRRRLTELSAIARKAKACAKLGIDAIDDGEQLARDDAYMLLYDTIDLADAVAELIAELKEKRP